MNNNFYKCVKLIKDRLSVNPLVHTVIFSRTNEKDLYKKNLFPIAHINPVTSPWTNNVNQFTFEIGVMEQRDLPNEQKGTKFETDDNIIDNLNLTYAILNDLISYLNLQDNDDRIEMVEASTIQPLIFTDFNILDGWVVSITLQIPNDEICFD